MNWEMCFKEAHEKEKFPSLIFAGDNFGVGQTGGPCPTLLGPGSVGLLLHASSFFCAVWMVSLPSQARAE